MNEILSGKICPYCKAKTSFVDSSLIYNKSYGMIYICFECDAYVGCHQGTDKAKGSLANYTSLLTEIAFNLISADNVPIADMDFTTLNGSILLREIIENHPTTFPCYWLNSNLLSAFLQTDLPDVMGMKRSRSVPSGVSHKYGTIFLPSGMIRSPDGYSVNWIIFAHRLKGEVSTIQLHKPQRIFNTYPEDMLQIFTTVGDATLYFSGCSLERTNENKLPYRESSLSSAEEEFINKLLSIAIQC